MFVFVFVEFVVKEEKESDELDMGSVDVRGWGIKEEDGRELLCWEETSGCAWREQERETCDGRCSVVEWKRRKGRKEEEEERGEGKGLISFHFRSIATASVNFIIHIFICYLHSRDVMDAIMLLSSS